MAREKDRFGYRFGTQRAVINAMMSETPITMRKIMTTLGLPQNRCNHVNALGRKGVVRVVGSSPKRFQAVPPQLRKSRVGVFRSRNANYVAELRFISPPLTWKPVTKNDLVSGNPAP
jgi:sugar-specific transcriptional regulator TrmB